MSEIIAYVYDFLSMVFEKGLGEKIEEIILFGSVAKKSFDKKSDIDLFFNVKDKRDSKELEESLKSALKSFEVKAEKTWGLKKVMLPIIFVVGSLEDEAWKGLRDEIISSGVLLYGHYKEMPEKLNHNYLFYYSLSNLRRNDKMKFIRKMFGYNLKKGKKEYAQEGFLAEIKGIKLGSNAILAPSQEVLKIKKMFNEFKISYKVIESWVRQ